MNGGGYNLVCNSPTMSTINMDPTLSETEVMKVEKELFGKRLITVERMKQEKIVLLILAVSEFTS